MTTALRAETKEVTLRARRTGESLPLRPATSGLRILLAEDDPEMRALVAGALRRDGFEVDEVDDGEALLDRIEHMVRTHRWGYYAAVVTDVRMPVLSGLDILAVLHCSGSMMPVIIITAFGDEEIHAEARELGAAAVFDKPFDVDALRDAVRSAVGT